MKNKKKIIIISILLVIIIWLTFFFVDSARVADEKEPLFCINVDEKGDGEHYVGLGYSFYVYQHPLTGKKEYSKSIFGIEISNNFTN